MPTLLTINNYHYRRGGADVAYLAQGELFKRRGWKVACVSMEHHANVPSRWSPFFVQEIEYGHRYGPVRVLKNAAKSIYSWEAASKVEDLIRSYRPDVAHAHNIYHHLSPSILRAIKKQNVPVFLTLHDLKLLCPARTMYTGGVICEACRGGKLRNVVFKRCMKGSLSLSSLIYVESTAHRMLNLYKDNVDRFISPSHFMIDKFVEWGWPRDRFAYVPNFVHAEQFEPEYSPGNAFLYFGRLSQEKGLSTLIRAAKVAGVPLWLVGTGPELEALLGIARECGADVTFFGFKMGEELWSLVRRARTVVLPSEWYENAPISILEAYSSGKPVIGARAGGIPEMVREGETGLLYESGSIEGLAGALRRAAEMPDSDVEAWGREARRRVVQKFSPAMHYERLLEVYAAHRPGDRIEPQAS